MNRRQKKKRAKKVLADLRIPPVMHIHIPDGTRTLIGRVTEVNYHPGQNPAPPVYVVGTLDRSLQAMRFPENRTIRGKLLV